MYKWTPCSIHISLLLQCFGYCINQFSQVSVVVEKWELIIEYFILSKLVLFLLLSETNKRVDESVYKLL